MEGTFAFFLESAFLGLFLFGEKRMSRAAHWWTGVAVFFGSWLSGYFIIATDAWMQHPVGLSGNCRRGRDVEQFLGATAESLGALAVFAQYGWRGGYRRFRHGGRRRLLPAQREAR